MIRNVEHQKEKKMMSTFHDHNTYPQVWPYIEAFERERDLLVLFASDNGSRAWGYSTPESDFDVKVLFVHAEDKYKNLWEPADVITYKPHDMYDFTFWDAKKALHLLWKGNAQIYEMMFSPQIYYHCKLAEQFKEFALNSLNENLKQVAYHYYGLAYKTYKERIRDVGEPTLKKYFYVLRPLLHVESMATFGVLPNLVFQDVLAEAEKNALIPQDVLDTTNAMLKLKREGNLTKVNHDELKLDHVDAFCEDRLAYWKENLGWWKFSKHDGEKVYTNEENFNNMFKKLVFSDEGI